MNKNSFSTAFSTESWSLISSPTQMILIISIYLLFVLKVGPRFMRDRKPMALRTFIRAYNIFQVIACTYFVSWTVDRGINPVVISFKCLANKTDSESVSRIYNASWYFLVLRLIELVETVIFVLRKKQNQVSSLHVYHHISTAVLLWLTFTSGPGE